jgi:hypothetical protein
MTFPHLFIIQKILFQINNLISISDICSNFKIKERKHKP